MRYDKDTDEISISVREFVSIARRGISPAMPYDDEEPCGTASSAYAKRMILGDLEGSTMYFGCEGGGYRFRLAGAYDGLKDGVLTIVKSVNDDPSKVSKSDLAQIRAEAFVLGYIYLSLSGEKRVLLRATFINEETLASTSIEECPSKKTLERFFDKCLVSVSLYARPECERVMVRLSALKELKFPFKNRRDGQEDFVHSVYKALRSGGTLYASAPTGTGKTVSVLYPALRAIGNEDIDKAFYLTPKTTTTEAAKDCLELFGGDGKCVRAVILSSKERCCKNGLRCRQSRKLCECSSSKKLADAVMALYDLSMTVITSEQVRKISEEFTVCPYELELSYAELSDVVICDFNYLFDPVVYIRRFFTEGGRYGFLIDEAHNLPDRAREMYSATLSESDLSALLDSPLLGPFSPLRQYLDENKGRLRDIVMPHLKDDMRKDEDGAPIGAAHLYDCPVELYDFIEELLLAADKELKSSYAANDEDSTARSGAIRDLYYKIKEMAEALARFDNGYRLFLFYQKDEISIKICCLDTGAAIRACTSKGKASVFFSATLSPIGYFKSLLGGDGISDSVEIDSPFDPSCLSVSVIDTVSTRYSERERTVPAVVRAIAATLSARRGNYMVFAPSFAYAEALYDAFKEKYPKIKAMLQSPKMNDKQKKDFLLAFETQSPSYLVGFCVMGGIYSEGIDLTGDSLIGAVVVGIGIPALSFEREAMADYYEQKYEEGKQFAYIYPGMNKVLQAAGRVIRSEDDRGVIVLIDDRFQDPIYKKSIPKLWESMAFIRDPKALKERLERFWAEVDKEAERDKARKENK